MCKWGNGSGLGAFGLCFFSILTHKGNLYIIVVAIPSIYFIMNFEVQNVTFYMFVNKDDIVLFYIRHL